MQDDAESVRTMAGRVGLEELFAKADHVDIKTVYGKVTLNAFLVGMLHHRPRWLRLLFHVRGVLARCMGLRHDAEGGEDLSLPTVSMTPGEGVRFFTVVEAREDRHWVAMAEDRHLAAWLVVTVTPLSRGGNRFDVATVVVYRHWTGPLYFNLIRPMHHLIVARAAKAGVAPASLDGNRHHGG